MTEASWHYARDGAAVGPVPHTELCALFAAKDLPLETLVWREGSADWAPASAVDDFRGIWGKGGFMGRDAGPPPLPPQSAADRPGVSPGDSASSLPFPDARATSHPQLGGEMNPHANPVRGTDEDVSQARPWVRYWARWLDRVVLASVFAILVALLRPTDPWYFLFLAVCLFFMQALLLSMFGTTVGKGILGISIETEQGERPTILQAMGREVGVHVFGRALGIILVGFYAMLHAYRCLLREGTTSYDRSRGLVVRHRRVGPLRVLVALSICVGAFSAVFMTVPAATRDRAFATALSPEWARGDVFGSMKLGWARQGMAATVEAVPATRPATQPANAKKPKAKPRLLTLPSEKATSKPPIKPTSPTTRRARRQDRPAPGVTFKPAPES